jgi:stage III sporulation protein AB
MLKWAGVALVLFAGTMIGFIQAARYAARPRQIRQLLHALQRLETEIGYGQTPLPEALIRISRLLQAPLSELFGDIARRLRTVPGVTVLECWDAAIAVNWSATAMKSGEREALQRLGSTLGASERDDQLKHLKLAALQLQAEEIAAREEQQKYEKLSRSLGVLGAALVVILMV